MRSFTLMPFGGAGPLHASDVAKALGIGTILVPMLQQRGHEVIGMDSMLFGPCVFGEKKARNADEAMEAWNKAKAGEKAKQYNKDYSYEEQLRYVEDVHKRSMNYIKANAKKEDPFFMCYWFHGPNAAGTHRLGRRGNSSISNADGDGFEEMDEKLNEMLSYTLSSTNHGISLFLQSMRASEKAKAAAAKE